MVVLRACYVSVMLQSTCAVLVLTYSITPKSRDDNNYTLILPAVARNHLDFSVLSVEPS